MSETVIISTDGSALSNPNGAMGWGWVNHEDDSHDNGGASNGTNQIGELCAILEGLRAHRAAQHLVIESDSQYAINCSTTWLANWKLNGWRNSKKQAVKNVQIIKAIDSEISNRESEGKTLDFKWVKGHAGDKFNEIVDDLAHGYATDTKNGVVEGKLPLEGWQALISSEYAQGLDIPSDVEQALKSQAAE